MSQQPELVVTLTVICKTQEDALKVVELLQRPLVGLAFDNLHGQLSVTPVISEE